MKPNKTASDSRCFVSKTLARSFKKKTNKFREAAGRGCSPKGSLLSWSRGDSASPWSHSDITVTRSFECHISAANGKIQGPNVSSLILVICSCASGNWKVVCSCFAYVQWLHHIFLAVGDSRATTQFDDHLLAVMKCPLVPQLLQGAGCIGQHPHPLAWG